MTDKCDICVMFDCGTKCRCKCHQAPTPIIRQDLDAEDVKQPQKSEEQAMEGLSALFG